MTLPAQTTEYQLREALAALERGWIPLPLDGKKPIAEKWTLLSVPSEADVEKWVREGRNIGVRTGAISGIVVIDEDTAKGGNVAQAFADLGIPTIPATPTMLTGGWGKHYYFRLPKGVKLGNSASKLGKAIDVKADGGQVVYAGSIHPDTQRIYAWAPTLSPDDVELAEIPSAVLDKLTKRRSYEESAFENEINRVRGAPEGERNTALNRAAFALGQLVGAGLLDEARVRTALRAASPLPEREAEATIESGVEAGKLEPRKRPGASAPAAGTDGASASVLTPGAHVTDQGEYFEIGTDDFVDSVLAALPESTLYRRGNVPGDLVGEPGWRSFRVAKVDQLRLAIDRNVRLTKWVQKRDDTCARVFQPCMRDWAHLLLAEAETSRRVQQIDILASYPIYTPDGVLARPGWNPGNVYYDEPESLRGLKPDPSRARDILEDLIVDFPFRDEASRQNFYGLLLTPIVRPMLRGHTPMHLVGASLPRTGKSLLTEQVLGGLLYGRATPARQLVGDEGEVEKRILAMLLCGETIINLDNLKEYLDSPSLAMLLTAETFGGRVLGLSVDAMVKNILTIVATGNNVRATGEIAKRIVPIVLQPKTDEPERRDDFVYEDLPRHVRESRRVVLEVLLGMVEAWIAAGRPRGSVRLGGFEQWAATVGGIMEYAGFREWGGNLREWQRAADPDGEDARAFEEAWWQKFGTDRVAPSELANLANEIRVFQSVLAKGGTERAVITAFSMRVLGRFLNTPIGESVVRVAPGRHGKMYYLERGVMFP